MNYIERNIKRKARFSHDAPTFEGGLSPIEYYETPPNKTNNNTNTMKKYRLLRDLPGYEAGTVFINDPPHGYKPESILIRPYTFYLPTYCICNESDWFEEIKEPKFTEQDMEAFAYFIHARRKFKNKTLNWGFAYLNEWLKENERA